MLAAHRRAASTHRCTVLGLAAALQAQWPIRDRGVHAPMPGRVLFSGVDGARGRCVVVSHAGDLASELCRLAGIEVKPGQEVKRGQRLGSTGPEEPRFGLRLGRLPVDPECLKLQGD
jgi:murein DD-endopeptidase MepM/ murein hydrolase activator NlpD